MDPTELENLVVTVMADATGYLQAMTAAENQAVATASTINNAMQSVQTAQDKALADAAMVIQAVEKPMERYARLAQNLKQHLDAGRISQEQFNRAMRNLSGLIPSSTGKMKDLDKEVNNKEMDFKKLGLQVLNTGRTLRSFGQSLSIWVTAPLTAMAVFSLRAFQQEEDAIFGLEAALRANGEEVEQTTKRHREFAAQMQAVTTVGDEVTIDLLRQAEAFNLTEEQATRAVRNAIALQAAYGAPLQMGIRATAALEFGHAEALQRVIKTLRDVKDPQEKAALAQQLLARGFEQATARAQTSSGQLSQLANDISDLQEQFGAIIAEALAPFVKWLRDLAKWMQNLSPQTKRMIVLIAAITAVVGPLMVAIGALIVVLGNLVAVLTFVAGALAAIDVALLPVIAVVLALVVAVGLAVGAWAMFTKTGQAAIDVMQGAMAAGLPIMIEGISTMADSLMQQLLPGLHEMTKKLTNIGDIGPPAFEETEQKLSELDLAVANFAKDMMLEAMTIGMTTREIQIYKFWLENANSAQLKWLRTLDEDLKQREAHQEATKRQMEAWNDLVKKGRDLNERYLTPLQKFRKQHAELSDMLNKGVITLQTYQRALTEASEDITIKVDFKTTGLDAVRAGTAEAMDLVNQFQEQQRQRRPAIPAPLRPVAAAGPAASPGIFSRYDLQQKLIALLIEIEKNTKKDPHKPSVELELEGANF